MDILFLLIPLSAVLVLAIVGLFGWALDAGQFEDLELEGERIFSDSGAALADSQVFQAPAPKNQVARFLEL